MLEPTETDPHLRIWVHLLLVPSFTWSIPPTCFKFSEYTKLNSILGALPYSLGSPAMHWKDGGCMSASLPMSFEVRGFFSISRPQRSPLGVFAFDVFPAWTALSEYLHTCLPPLYFPGLSLRSSLQRGPNTQSHSYHQDLLYCLHSTYCCLKLWIHWFVYFFTVSPFPHHESRNSAFVTHQYNPSAYSKSWSIGSVL